MSVKRLRLGSIATMTKSGYIIVKIENPAMRVKIGGKVEDDKGAEIGKIIDIIGNIEKPYAVVKPTSDTSSLNQGDILYLVLQRGRRGSRRKGGSKSAGRKGRKPRRMSSGGNYSYSRRNKGLRKRRQGSEYR